MNGAPLLSSYSSATSDDSVNECSPSQWRQRMHTFFAFVLCFILVAVFFSSGCSAVSKGDKRCKEEWTLYKEHCYTVTEKGKFAAGEAKCERMGGVVASVHNTEQNNFLAKLVRVTHAQEIAYYIGLQRNATGQLNWFDGSDFDFENWNKGEPNNAQGNEFCVETWSHYGYHAVWNDLQCDNEFPTVCQKELIEA